MNIKQLKSMLNTQPENYICNIGFTEGKINKHILNLKVRNKTKISEMKLIIEKISKELIDISEEEIEVCFSNEEEINKKLKEQISDSICGFD